jgi:hypothetical protein
MLIPYTFKLSGSRFRVQQTHAVGNTMGQCMPDKQTIFVAVSSGTSKRDPVDVAETFWHEVTHAILHDMQHKLWRDEAFVTAFSKRLNQVIHTAKLP